METGIEHERVMVILQEALQQQPEDREGYVRSACDGDQNLYREVADRLQWEERMGSFLLEPLVDFAGLVRPFEPGGTIGDGRFEILREIGEGGMGVVYEAFDRKLQQRIAIKAAKPGFQRLLSPELKAALKVRHQNICLVKEIHTAQTDYGEVDFLAMELLEGETLSAHLANTDRLSHAEALAIACQICSGLAEAHRSGIIHRDLKSSNVILCKNEDGTRRAVITDFGLAAGPAITSGELAGTPAYMAPELWRGDQPSKASDVYALGVMLYEMVVGRRPYQGTDSTDELGITGPLLTTVTQEQWHHRAQTEPPPPPSRFVKHLDPRWDRAIMRCLQPSPGERPEASEVLFQLQRRPTRKALFAVPALLILALVAFVALVRPVRQWLIEWLWRPHLFNVREQQLTANPLEDRVTAAAISPDGKYVAYHDLTGLYLRSIESGESRLLPVPKEVRGRISVLKWFPGGEKLLGNVLSANGADLWVIGVLHSEDTRLVYQHADDPAISPDGKHIAFINDYSVEPARHLFVGDTSGSTPRELIGANENKIIFKPTWSPDGRWIAYARNQTTTHGLSSAIEMRPASGGPAKILVADARSFELGKLFDPTLFTQSWSPDWRLIFSVIAGPQHMSAQTKYSLWEIRVDSSTVGASVPEQLTQWSQYTSTDLTISADGKRMSYIKQRSWMDVYVGELGHGGTSISTPWRMTLDNRGSNACRWMPDSQSIFFESDRSGKMEIFRQGVHEGHATRVISGVDGVSCVEVSPDGSWLLYFAPESNNTRARESTGSGYLMRRAIEGGKAEKVLAFAPTDDIGCSSNAKSNNQCILSRYEGEELVFYSFEPTKGRGKRLVSIELGRAPSWLDWSISPDGTRLVLLFPNVHGGRIEVVTLADGSRHEVTLEPGAGSLRSIAWAADGDGFFLTSQSPDSYRVLHVTLTGKVQLLRDGQRQFLYRPLPSPDGKYLAFYSKTFDSNVWMIDNF